MRSWLLGLALLFVACGPSTQEVKTAKLARYSTSQATLFDIAVAVAGQTYKIGESDRPTGQFATVPQFFDSEGTSLSYVDTEYVGRHTTRIPDRSLLFAMLVEILKADRGHIVVVTPKVHQMLAGSPKPRELTSDDPNMPGWVHGRVDALTVAIYNAAKQHAIP